MIPTSHTALIISPIYPDKNRWRINVSTIRLPTRKPPGRPVRNLPGVLRDAESERLARRTYPTAKAALEAALVIQRKRRIPHVVVDEARRPMAGDIVAAYVNFYLQQVHNWKANPLPYQYRAAKARLVIDAPIARVRKKKVTRRASTHSIEANR